MNLKEQFEQKAQGYDVLKYSKSLILLIMLYLTVNLIAGVVVFKIIKLGPAEGPGGLLVLPFVFLIEEVIAEVYGYRTSRFLIWATIGCAILFNMVTLFITQLPSPAFWHYQQDFNVVFLPFIRCAPAGMIAIIAGRLFNVYIISKLKIKMRGKRFWVRSLIASLSGDTLVVGIFYIAAFLGTFSASNLERLFFTDYFIRISYAIVGVVPAALLAAYLKSKEKIDIYDYDTNFNPFSLKIVDKINKK